MQRIRLRLTHGARSRRPRSPAGFSVIEAVAAIAVLGVFMSGAAAALTYGTQAAGDNGLRARAAALAVSGIEAVRGIRDADFANLSAGTYGLSDTGGQWQLTGGTETLGPFTREITVIEDSADVRTVVATVSWGDRSVAATTQLTNWQAERSGGGGQPGGATCDSYAQLQGYASGTCRQNTQKCTQNGETHLPGGDAYCAAPPNDTCCVQ